MQHGWMTAMPPMSARSAAELTGKDRSTILRAIETGRLSATRDDRGHYLIDPAELERVYGSLRSPAEPADAASQDA
jgi:excisionase family DNA binding protein